MGELGVNLRRSIYLEVGFPKPIKAFVGPLDFYMSYGSVEMNFSFEIKSMTKSEKHPGTENSYSL